MHMSCMHFHSLPSARVVSVGPVCDPQNQVGVIGLTGMIQKNRHAVWTLPTPCACKNTTCIQNVDDLRVLTADFLSPRRHRECDDACDSDHENNQNGYHNTTAKTPRGFSPVIVSTGLCAFWLHVMKKDGGFSMKSADS